MTGKGLVAPAVNHLFSIPKRPVPLWVPGIEHRLHRKKVLFAINKLKYAETERERQYMLRQIPKADLLAPTGTPDAVMPAGGMPALNLAAALAPAMAPAMAPSAVRPALLVLVLMLMLMHLSRRTLVWAPVDLVLTWREPEVIKC
jgi:hypothetical protein